MLFLLKFKFTLKLPNFSDKSKQTKKLFASEMTIHSRQMKTLGYGQSWPYKVNWIRQDLNKIYKLIFFFLNWCHGDLESALTLERNTNLSGINQ